MPYRAGRILIGVGGAVLLVVLILMGAYVYKAAGLRGTGDAEVLVVPDELPAVVKSTLTPEARAAANAAGLEMPLKQTFSLPTGQGWVYEGALAMDGPGPLGMMHYKARIHLKPQAGDAWPLTLKSDMEITEYRGEGAFGSTVVATPEDLGGVEEMPSTELAQSGRVATGYNPGEAPLTYLGDLWGLPLEPLEIGDSFVEAVAAEGEYILPFKGVRSIKLVRTEKVRGVPCAVYEIESRLEAKDIDVGNSSACLRMVITSTLIFDAANGWPLEAKQDVKINGIVDDGGKERVLKISFSVKRVEAVKPQ